MKVKFSLNGKDVSVEAQANWKLLDVLREEFQLMGTKKGCGTGECGACTVILDGKNVNSCMIPIGSVEGKEVITIEGLSKNGELHPIQRAFAEKGAVQCGFCTPGMILSTKVLLDKNPKPDREEIKDAISGNICRCTGYEQIFEAIESVNLGGENSE